MLARLWPAVDEEYIDAVKFELMYKQHGGSGLNCTRADVLDMDWSEALDYCKRLSERRDAESQKMKAAQASGARSSKGRRR